MSRIEYNEHNKMRLRLTNARRGRRKIKPEKVQFQTDSNETHQRHKTYTKRKRKKLLGGSKHWEKKITRTARQ